MIATVRNEVDDEDVIDGGDDTDEDDDVYDDDCGGGARKKYCNIVIASVSNTNGACVKDNESLNHMVVKIMRTVTKRERTSKTYAYTCI